MKWPWSRRSSDREHLLRAAEKESRELGERAERVGAALRERLGRNHWSESVSAIARRDRS